MKDCRQLLTPEYGKELTLMQVQESFLGEGAKRISSYCRQCQVPGPGDTLRIFVGGRPNGEGNAQIIKGAQGSS